MLHRCAYYALVLGFFLLPYPKGLDLLADSTTHRLKPSQQMSFSSEDTLAQLQRRHKSSSRFKIPNREATPRTQPTPQTEDPYDSAHIPDAPLSQEGLAETPSVLHDLFVILGLGLGAAVVFVSLRKLKRKISPSKKKLPIAPKAINKRKLLENQKSVSDVQKQARDALQRIGKTKQQVDPTLSEKTKERISSVIARLVKDDDNTLPSPSPNREADAFGDAITNPGLTPSQEPNFDEITNVQLAPKEQDSSVVRLTVDLEDLFTPSDFETSSDKPETAPKSHASKQDTSEDK